MPEHDPRPTTRTIALMNQKGGVGKTTTTINLAAGIARAGRRVLVIDLDPQAHATLHVGIDPGALSRGADPPGPGSVYDVLMDPEVGCETVWRKAGENFYILPSETDLAAVESELADAPDRTSRLRRALALLPEPFEFILIDCPPSLGLLTLNALAAAREVFIPMQAHYLALQGVSKLLQTVSLVSKQVNPRLRVTGVVLCMHDPSLTHSKEVVADLESFLEDARFDPLDVPWKSARVLSPAVRRNVKLAECPSFGQTIFQYAPSCPGAQDYAALAQKMVAEWDALRARTGPRSAESPPAPEVKVVRSAAAAPLEAGPPA